MLDIARIVKAVSKALLKPVLSTVLLTLGYLAFALSAGKLLNISIWVYHYLGMVAVRFLKDLQNIIPFI